MILFCQVANMNSNLGKFLAKYIWIIFILLLLSVAVIAYGGYRYYELESQLVRTQGEFASSTAAFQAEVTQLTMHLVEASQTNSQLTTDLQNERNRVDNLAHEVSKVTGTVGTLEKLSKIDPELLQKYSKVYFLNENYVPDQLTAIPLQYLYNNTQSLLIQVGVWRYLERLMNDVAASSQSLKILSAFRSFGEQSSLKSNYKLTYGSGANQFSADQGYSEHQLGTTVDLTTPNQSLSVGFADTPEYEWLVANAHRYGFVLSYPEDNQYYQFEPWHWRFVGVELATRLHNEGKDFYDLDQREIDTYLIKFFD